MKKRTLLIFSLLLCAGIMWLTVPGVSAKTGSGTAGDPYVLRSAPDLLSMHNDLDAYYVLGSDIDMAGTFFDPVGNEAEGAFSGYLDGQGHTISNLTIETEGIKYVGLFGYLEGTVKNIRFSNAILVGERYVGTIAGCAGYGSSISGCEVISGSVTGIENQMPLSIGGIAGLCEGNVYSCTNNATIVRTGSKAIPVFAGGIAGTVSGEMLNAANLYNTGNISINVSVATSAYVGGLFGSAENQLTLSNPRNEGSIEVTVSGTSVGGLIGESKRDVSIISGHNAGNLHQDTYPNFSTAYYTNGAVHYWGGLIGHSNAAVSLIDCDNTAEVYCRGLARWSTAGQSGYSAKGIVRAGGLIGCSGSSATIDSCHNTGNVSALGSESCAGGITAIAQGAQSYSNSINTGQITLTGSATGNNGGGGLVGLCTVASDYTECKNYGGLSGPYLGGFVGNASVTQVFVRCVNFLDQDMNLTGGMVGQGSDASTECVNTSYAAKVFGAGSVNCVNYGNAPVLSNGAITIAPYSGSSSYLGRYAITLDGVVLRDDQGNAFRCSDLKCVDSLPEMDGYPLSEITDPTSSFYATWDLTQYVIDPNWNSGIPMPKDYPAEYLNETILILHPGETAHLNAPFSVKKWKTSNSSVAGCEGGTVTAITPGVSCISAVGGRDHWANCLVYVIESVDSVSLSGSSSVTIGNTVTLTVDLDQDDKQGVIWSTSNPEIATVSQSGSVKGIKAGTVEITAYLPLSGVSATKTVTVRGKTITKITLYNCSVTVGTTSQITRSISPGYDFLNDVVWSSSNEAVATVDQTGVVTGVTPGTAIITAYSPAGNVSGTCTVTVTAPATSVTLEPTLLTLTVGHTGQLTATVLPDNTTDTLSWSSNNTSIATVSSNGAVTGVKAGTAMITARTTSGKQATCMVTVVPAPVNPESVTLDQRSVVTYLGEETKLNASILPVNATETALIWESSDPDVASVNEYGLVSALSEGTAVIRVSTVNGLYDECTFRVLTPSSASFVIEDSRCAIGETVETAVSITRNPGISAFTMEVVYDPSALTPTAVESADLLANGLFTSNIDTAASDGFLRVTWSAPEDMDSDGVIFTIRWQASEQPSTASVSLSFGLADVCNAEQINIHVAVEPGTVYINDRQIGDIYYDGLVNMKDIVYFSRWFNLQEDMDDSQRLAADILFDRQLDIRDLSGLAQILGESMSTHSFNPPASHTAGNSIMGGNDTVSDETAYRISIADTVADSETVVLTVVGDNCSGIASFRFKLTAPEGYRIDAVEACELLSGGSFTYNADTGILLWYSNTDQTLNGDLFTITLVQTGSVELPERIGMEYLPTDFFKAGSYSEIPVELLIGQLIEDPTATLSMNETSIHIPLGTTYQLNATSNKTISWSVRDSKILSVDENGVVTPLYPGKTTVTASILDGVKQAVCEITVEFADVTDDAAFYYSPVYWAVGEGITSGYTDKNGKLTGLFGPDDSCTRAQIVTFLYRAAGSPAVNTANAPKFKDVKKTDYFYKAVIWAAQNKITTGYTDKNGKPTGYFGSNDECTRGQIVTFLYRWKGEPAINTSKLPAFKDVKKTDYYYKAVVWAYQNNITTGLSKTKFAPNDTCVRGQVVTFLYRAR